MASAIVSLLFCCHLLMFNSHQLNHTLVRSFHLFILIIISLSHHLEEELKGNGNQINKTFALRSLSYLKEIEFCMEDKLYKLDFGIHQK